MDEGKNCQACHQDEEADLGNTIVSGKKPEPNPIPGKAGSIKVTVQAAYDKEYFYLKASWPAKEMGNFHNYKGFKDGN